MRQGCDSVLIYVKETASPTDSLLASVKAAASVATADPELPKPDLSHVPEEYQERLRSILDTYSDVFCEKLSPAKPKIIDEQGTTIPLLPGSTPAFRKNYRMSPAEMHELRTQVQDYLDRGWIRPSTSPFGAPVLFVKKPKGTGFRCCLDYRELNKKTVRNRWPLARIDDILDQVRGASYFSCLDLASGYYQIGLAECDIPKTAFSTPWAHYEWVVLPQGLTNAPQTFVRCLSEAFGDLIGKTVLIYLDDLLVLGRTPDEQLTNLETTLAVLRKHGLYAKLSKCDFFKRQITYVGHVLSEEGVKPDESKVKSLLEWPYPRDQKGMLQFLGLANYFRKFVKDFSRISAPLYHLTKTTTLYSCSDEYQLAFTTLKSQLMNPPTLAFPDPEEPYELISDASVTGCGAVLIQKGRPVAYYSAKFSSAEFNYTTTEQEQLGIIKALKEWRCYLEGCKGLTIHTDHNPLIYLKSQPMLSRRQARWLDFLSRFEFEIKHIEGSKNPADSLSRLHSAALCSLFLALHVSQVDSTLRDRLIEGYANDPLFSHEQATKKMTKEHDLWFYKGRIMVPKSLRSYIIDSHHNNKISGHQGMDRTYDLISRQFAWPRMVDEIRQYVTSCNECQRNKAVNHKPFGLLQPLAVPDTRWHTVTMDFITDLPTSPKGNNTVLVFVDKLSKYIHIAATKKTCNSEDAARLFIENIFQFHGMPKCLISDRDGRFISDFWKSFAAQTGMDHRTSTSFHPQTDGTTERMNRVIEEVMRCFVNDDHTNWEEMLPLVTFAINNSKCDATKETPFFLNHGTHPTTMNTIFTPTEKLPTLDVVLRDMRDTLDEVKLLYRAAQDRARAIADRRRIEHHFTEGQLVLLSSQNLKFKKGIRKLHPKFVGPFKILKMVGSNAAKLQLPKTYRIHPVFHVSLLEPFLPDASFKPLPPNPEIIDGLPFYKVERILSKRSKQVGRGRKRTEYLIKWEGYDDSHNSWEPEKNLTPDLIASYSDK